MKKGGNKSKKNIVLFGFMGTGKTSVGRILAGKLGLRFIDMDVVIEERQKKSISSIFAEEGEQAFRKMERDLVRELAGGSGMVIATGGGVVLNRVNVDDFARTGLAVCLRATPEDILDRLKEDTTRPLLAEGDKMQKVAALLEKRRPFYESVPVQVDTSGLTVEQVADRILSIYRESA